MRRLPVLQAGKKYTGYIGFSDGEPMPAFEMLASFPETEFTELFPTKASARRMYEDVRRVTIIIEGETR